MFVNITMITSISILHCITFCFTFFLWLVIIIISALYRLTWANETCPVHSADRLSYTFVLCLGFPLEHIFYLWWCYFLIFIITISGWAAEWVHFLFSFIWLRMVMRLGWLMLAIRYDDDDDGAFLMWTSVSDYDWPFILQIFPYWRLRCFRF